MNLFLYFFFTKDNAETFFYDIMMMIVMVMIDLFKGHNLFQIHLSADTNKHQQVNTNYSVD